MGRIEYPRARLLAFRGTISAIGATLRGVGRELEEIGTPQEVLDEVAGLANEVKALFERGEHAYDQNYADDVYEHLYISTAFKLHLILQYVTPLITSAIAFLAPSEQAALKRVSLLPMMQKIILTHLRNISAELKRPL